MILELCLENHTRLDTAISHQVARIELCDNLAAGGTTVSYGVAKYVLAKAHQFNIEVMALLRPRSGDFVYTEADQAVILEDLAMLLSLNVDGIAFGALTKAHQLDVELTSQIATLTQSAKKLLTFHMAFDHIDGAYQLAAIDRLVELGFSRILSHGSAEKNPIEENIAALKSYIAYANNRLIILPGGAVHQKNAAWVQKQLGCPELHGTALV